MILWIMLIVIIVIKYKTDISAFTRKGKLGFGNYTLLPIVSEGRTNHVEVNSYIRRYMDDNTMTITKQAESYQRPFIKPEVYQEMILDANVNMMNAGAYPNGFKGLTVLGCDGSDLDVPPHKITIDEFNIPSDTLVYKQPAQTLCSSISDLYNNYIWDITLADACDDERSIFLEQLNHLDKKINLENCLFIFDRGYPSVELFLELIEKEAYFIFRLPEGKYTKEREKMLSDDEYVNLILNSIRTNKIRNPSIKEKVKTMTHIRLRIVNIPIKTNNNKTITESLITNVPPEIANPQELKMLYGKRWDIEKKLRQNEKHTRNRKLLRIPKMHHTTRHIRTSIPTKLLARNKTRHGKTNTPTQTKKQKRKTTIPNQYEHTSMRHDRKHARFTDR